MQASFPGKSLCVTFFIGQKILRCEDVMKVVLLLCLLMSSVYANEMGVGVEFEKLVRDAYDGPIIKRFEPITRSEVLKRAEAALNFQYTVKQPNFSIKKIKNQCAGQNIWLRPYKIHSKFNKQVIGIPYKWGGYFQELSYFAKAMKQGKILGDVCTCRDSNRNYCVRYESLGLDCSGFVSYAWQTKYHPTSRVHRISHEIEWDELKPGDALNKAGEHIIMFKSYSKDKNYIHAIESTVRCDGVCETTFRKYDLKREGFKPIRFDNIIDG
jgi:hypothetical protein